MKKDYITKSFRLHKQADKKLIEILSEFSADKKLSLKVKEILELYFSLKDKEQNELLERLRSIDSKVSELKTSGISISSPINKAETFVPVINREQKSITELMGGLMDSGDDDLDLSL